MLVRRRGLVFSCALAAVCLCTVAGVAGIAFAEECEQESDSEACEGAAVVADESSDDDEFTFQLTDYLQETPAPARPRLGEQAAPLPAQALPLTQDIFVNEELRRRLVGSGAAYPISVGDQRISSSVRKVPFASVTTWATCWTNPSRRPRLGRNRGRPTAMIHGCAARAPAGWSCPVPTGRRLAKTWIRRWTRSIPACCKTWS